MVKWPEPLYKGQVKDRSFVPSTNSGASQVKDRSFVPSTVEPLYKGQVKDRSFVPSTNRGASLQGTSWGRVLCPFYSGASLVGDGSFVLSTRDKLGTGPLSSVYRREAVLLSEVTSGNLCSEAAIFFRGSIQYCMTVHVVVTHYSAVCGLIRLVISLECFIEITPEFLCSFMND